MPSVGPMMPFIFFFFLNRRHRWLTMHSRHNLYDAPAHYQVRFPTILLLNKADQVKIQNKMPVHVSLSNKKTQSLSSQPAIAPSR